MMGVAEKRVVITSPRTVSQESQLRGISGRLHASMISASVRCQSCILYHLAVYLGPLGAPLGPGGVEDGGVGAAYGKLSAKRWRGKNERK